jgi:hypothetical protein
MLQLHLQMLPPIEYWGDCRARRVGQAIIVLWVLGLADLIFTIWAHQFTPFRELNPLARQLLSQNWMGGLILFKLALTSLGTAIFWYLRGHGRAEACLWGLVVIYFALAVRWSHYTTDVLAMM